LGVLAVVVASYRLGAKSFWLDEAASVVHARAGLVSFLKTLGGGDPNGGLYYALLHIWVPIFGSGEVAVRSLSVACGAAAVVGMVMLGNRLYGPPAGLISALLLALAPFSSNTSRRPASTRSLSRS
jgi:mannosyltransferase